METSEETPKAEAKVEKKTAAIAKNGEMLPTTLKLTDIVLGDNVRSDLGNISDLAASITSEGLIEPVIVTPMYDDTNKFTGKYGLSVGYRRYAAAKQAGLKEVPVRVMDLSDDKKLRVALIENIQREDMNPLDKARGIQMMLAQEGMDQKTAAKTLGVSEGFISQHLGLLKLPKQVQNAIKNEKIDFGQARLLAKIKDEEKMVDLLPAVPDLTSSQLQIKVEQIVSKIKEKEEAEKEKAEASEKKKPKKAKSEGEDDAEEDAKPAKKSLAEKYAEMELEPLTKSALREQLEFYANKLERSESEEKRMEYKFILKGMEICAGLKE